MPAPRGASPSQQSLVSRLNESAKSGLARVANNQVSLDKYFRSADLLQRQANLYRVQHNDEQLYVMLLRFVSLVVETIPRHQGHSKENASYLRLRKDSLAAMAELERLKVALELKDKESRELERAPFMAVKAPGAVPLSAGNLPELHWDSLQPPALAPAGSFPGETDFFGQPLLGSAPLPGAAPVVLPQLPELPILSSSVKLRPASQATLSKHAILPSQSLGARQQQLGAAAEPPATAQQQQQQQQQRRSLYPEFAPPPTQQQPGPSSIEAQLAGLDMGGSSGPGPPLSDVLAWPQPSPYAEMSLGPQEVGVTSVAPPSGPLAPGETCCTPPGDTGNLAMVEAASSRVGVAEVKRRQSMRDVHVSVALMDEFMRYAISNTKRGIETCGILAGVLSANDSTFTITALIVPRQEGTTDTVQALNEEDIFEAQDSRGLYPLGWIHTHPTQTCFLSSVDVHTHCGYQTMLDEAVAIVMAPRDPAKRVGIFRLSTPGGLKLVQRCMLRGFHHHEATDTGQPLYELCGHVYLNSRVPFEVLDLR